MATHTSPAQWVGVDGRMLATVVDVLNDKAKAESRASGRRR